MFNVQGTSEDEVKTRTIECKYGLKPSLTPEALPVGAYLPQKIFTRNNLSRNSVVEIVISPLDWGGAMKLFKTRIIVIFSGILSLFISPILNGFLLL